MGATNGEGLGAVAIAVEPFRITTNARDSAALPAGAQHSHAAGTDLDADTKAWTTLVARACLRGYQLWRSDATDGPRQYFLGRWGMVRCCNAGEIERVLEQVGA